jgi:SPP1 family predicted phage head-tail adaptor
VATQAERAQVKVGKFDQRITLQRRIEERNVIGESVITYQNAISAWAAVEPLTGRELFAAQQTQSEITTRIRMHWQRGITERMRVVHVTSYRTPRTQDVYDVLAVLDDRSQHQELQLMCVRRDTEQAPLRPTITADMDSITADNG